MLALFLQLMRLNGEASLAQEPNLLDVSTNHQLQDRTTNQINNKDSKTSLYIRIKFLHLIETS